MRYLYTLFCLLVALSASAQTVTYYDADWKETSKDKAAFYSQTNVNADGSLTVLDYFISGQLQMQGRYQTTAKKVREGEFSFWYANGQLSSKGSYRGNVRSGAWVFYHQNGKIAEQREYDKRGNKMGRWEGWYANGNKDYEGSFKRGREDGVWRWYFETGQLAAEETYSEDGMIDSKYYNQLGVACNDGRCGTAQPAYRGGEQALFAYVKRSLTYPPTAVAGSTGEVWIRFKISKSGKIEEISVAKSLSPVLDEEAMRVVRNMPDWLPGKKHNRPTEYYLELPFYFQGK